MLAQNFKTPADLGLTDIEFESLLRVLRMLERGEIKEAPQTARFGMWLGAEPPTMFRMANVMGSCECGTAACLLGWARHIAGDERLLEASTKGCHPANELFFPRKDRGVAIACRNPAIGAIALRNFLTFGEPRWDEAMAD